MSDGWIKLHRKITEKAVWQDPEMLKLWLYCLLKPTHTEKEIMVGKQKVKLSPGQFVTGRFDLAEDYNKGAKKSKIVPARTLWRWLKKFEEWGMLSIKSTTKFSVVTITNWDAYQQNDQQVTNKWPANDQQMTTNKNIDDDDDEKWWSDLAETETERPDVAEVRDYYTQKIGRLPNINDLNQMQELLDRGFTVEKIKRGIDHALATYKPRYNGDAINSFLYCSKAIQTLYTKQDKPSGGWKPRHYVEPARPNVITEDAVAKYRKIYEERVKKKQVK